MKHLYRITIVLFLLCGIVGVARAQSKDTRWNGNIQHDTCAFFIMGKTHYDYGLANMKDGYFKACPYDFRNAIQYFNLHRIEHPQDETTLAYLDTIYGFYALFENYNDEENLKTTLSNLPYVKRIGEFLRNYDDIAIFLGITFSEIGQDYCELFHKTEKTIGLYDDDFDRIPNLHTYYKALVFDHARFLFLTYCNDSYNTISIINVTDPDWERCVGGQTLDRCFEDLNIIVNNNQTDNLKDQIDTLALVLLGECHYFNDDFKKATDCYEKSGLTPKQLIQTSDYVSAHCFMDSYIKQGFSESEQVANLLNAMVDYWYEHYLLLYMDQACYDDPELQKTGAKLLFAQTVMAQYYINEEYEKGLDFWFKIKNNFSLDPTLNLYQGLCRSALGDPSATEELEFAAHLNPKDMLANYLFMVNNLNQGVLSSNIPFGGTLTGDKHVREKIDTTYYLLSGLSLFCQQDYASAINNFQMLSSTPSNNLLIAICYQKLAVEESNPEMRIGYETASEQYFHEVIAEEKQTGRFENTPYAYLYLHEKNKAVEAMERILQTDLFTPALTQNDSLLLYGVYYQAAEIYANAGQLKKAKWHIEKAFEYCHNPLSLTVAKKAPLLSAIQGYVEQLVGQYEQQQGFPGSHIHRDTLVCDITYEKNGISNTKNINCEINGVPLRMLFDPGADYVQLSKEIADSIGVSNDSIGWIPTRSANGSVSVKPIVSLNSVKIGDIELKNVQAVIDDNPKAPLLLGCTVWNNLKVEMPSPKKKGMIRLTYIKESIEVPKKQKKR